MSLANEPVEPHELTDEELRERLDSHQRWLKGEEGERADLRGVVDLMGGRLAGADLSGALMPPQLRRFRELVHVDQTVTIARPIYLILIFICAYTIIVMFSADDVSIVTNSRIQLLPELGLGIPVSGFFIIVPIILFGLFVYLHLYLYRMWQILGSLPSVFHDGTPLEQAISPWLITAMVRFHQRYGVKKPSMLGISQKCVTIVLVWWMAPITLALLWARYLVRHDWPGTVLHIALVAVAIWSAVILYEFAVAGLRREPRPYRGTRGLARSLSLLAGFGVLFAILSVGAFEGTRESLSMAHARTWVPGALNLIGMQPSADMSGWELEEGKENLSYMDLRGANLVDAKLTRLVDEKLNSVNLERSDLRRADLSGADLEEANLNFANLENASLWNARLRNADLSNTVLRHAILDNADSENAEFRNADLQEARLNGANLKNANFSNADLRGAGLSDADLRNAQMLRADLRRADLGLIKLNGANLFGADLADADMLGAVLDGADLSKVRGLKQEQLDQACGEDVKGLGSGYTIKPCPKN